MQPVPRIMDLNTSYYNSNAKGEINPIPALRKLILDLAQDSTQEGLQKLQAISFLLHEIISPIEEEAFINMLEELFQSNQFSKSLPVDRLIFLFESLICHGPTSINLLIELKKFLRKGPNANLFASLIPLIDQAICDKPPGASPLPPKISPQENMLAWMDKGWSARNIGGALTVMCLPFYELRSCEFLDESKSGPHLEILNKRCRTLTHFVATSILAAATISEKKALKCVEKWLDIGEDLHSRNNFHMLFAIQNGLQLNSVDRLPWLKQLPRNASKMKEKLDALFNVDNKMLLLNKKEGELRGKTSIIPCIYRLHRNAIQSREAPLFLADGSINVQRIISANNIFANMIKMQRIPYETIKVSEEVLSYFLCLEQIELQADEDKLREISNSVLNQEARSTFISLEEPISWEKLFVNPRNRIEPKAKKKLSMPLRLASSSVISIEDQMTSLPEKKKTNSAPGGLDYEKLE
ncbi:MAG: hypothetical protein JSS30_01325 [Verrucomicrobia bacterium]|nr:hypothetical protein [Verrucomicrobiota bacterium]